MTRRRRRVNNKQEKINSIAKDSEALHEIEEKIQSNNKRRKSSPVKESTESKLKTTKAKAHKAPRVTIKSTAIELMQEGKYTDDKIVEICKERFPESKCDTGNIKWYRWKHNKDNPDNKLEQVVEVDGEMVSKTSAKAAKAESKPTARKKSKKSAADLEREEEQAKAILSGPEDDSKEVKEAKPAKRTRRRRRA